MMKVSYAIATLLVIAGLAPFKARADGCAMIYMKNHLNATVHASPARAISLEFPRPYEHYRITNGELWSVDDASTGTPENVLIVGPRLPGLTNQGNAVVRFNGDQPSDPALHMDLYEPLLKLYRTSQLHVYTIDRKHYSLTVKVADRHPSCYVFVDTEQRTTNVTSADRAVDGARDSRTAAQARETLDQYRQSIFTGYTWTPPEGWYGAPIDSVYDDGRFTWVRIKDGSRGPMVVRAVIDDQRVIVQNTYDAEKLLYRIHGVFPKLLLQHGSSELTIARGNAP